MKLRFPILAAALLALAALAFSQARSAAAAAPPAGPAGEIGPGLPSGGVLAGFEDGLYRVDPSLARVETLWSGGEVRKILRPGDGSGWWFLSSRGPLFSADLLAFEARVAGLPVKTYKRVEGGAKTFLRETMDLKDLELDPADSSRLATCTKDAVFVSLDGGRSWKDFGSPVATTGLKAVLLAPHPKGGEPAVWASHPIKGLFAKKLAGNSAWEAASAGLAVQTGTTSVEEVADLVLGPPVAPAAVAAPAGGPTAGPAPQAAPKPGPAALWASNSFQSRIYRWDGAAGSWRQAWGDGADFGTAESLEALGNGGLRFVGQGAVMRLDAAGKVSRDGVAETRVLAAAAARGWKPGIRGEGAHQLLALSWYEGGKPASLSELWLAAFADRKPWRAAAENREGIYLQTGYVVNPASRAKNLALIADRGLNSLVVDMKDDNGRLRFAPRDPLLKAMGRTAGVLDVEAFAAEAKAKGVYLVARIVVFKDEVVYRHAGGKYAAWDEAAKTPWRGYELVTTVPPAPATPAPPPAPITVREPIEEYWVDPYSEEVWAYNVAIANEIVARGFDEVQFDYIRFPTDGANIDEVSFRWRDPGMDKESALASFLRFARERIAAPISIDIYGANGWYRSGVRTGQDVELLAAYVDAICPMLYPSHFEQGFLAEPPAEERPYRVYRLGTLRNAHIARGRVVVRPYIQAFFLNVSYDRSHYGPDYVRREVAGVRDAVNLGMTFWNNVARYDEVPRLGRGPDGRLSTIEGWAGARPAAPDAAAAAAPAGTATGILD